ncbi:MAG: class II aldolase/adducin family protein [Bacillota bacterium]|nr:class II aldolase/adducin family protein [Bacillota bacterium]
MDNIVDLKQKIASSCRILYSEGHHDYVWGHVSARIPGEDKYWMKPKGLGLNEIGHDELILLDFDGNKLDGNGNRERHAEFPIHSEIYRIRQDVNCVIHTHPFYATLIAALGEFIKPLTHDGCLFVNAQVFFNETSDLIISEEVGKKLANCLGKNTVAFLRNHGVVVVGKDVEEATGAAIFLERASKYQVYSNSLGIDKCVCSSEQEVENRLSQHFSPQNYRSLFSYLQRMCK